MRVGDWPTGFGVGIDQDIVTASLHAVISGLNRHLAMHAAESSMARKEKAAA